MSESCHKSQIWYWLLVEVHSCTESKLDVIEEPFNSELFSYQNLVVSSDILFFFALAMCKSGRKEKLASYKLRWWFNRSLEQWLFWDYMKYSFTKKITWAFYIWDWAVMNMLALSDIRVKLVLCFESVNEQTLLLFVHVHLLK